MATRAEIDEFLGQRRLAFVGVSRNSKEFANEVYRQMRARGYDLVPVNAAAEAVEGDRCYPDLASIPEPVDGAMVMVSADRSADVVDQCASAGISRVWLHRGVGRGAVSEEAIGRCRAHGMSVVDGYCPMMFLEPVRSVHRFHRFTKRLAGSLPR